MASDSAVFALYKNVYQHATSIVLIGLLG